MDDYELANVAAFKLREAANRMTTLADAAGSPRLRLRLLSLAKQLLIHEGHLYERQHKGPLGAELTASPAARIASGN